VLGAIKIYQNISREKRRQRDGRETAESREQRAESRETAESREQRAEQTNIFLGLSRGGITQW
jgi:hypothetical protein